MKLAQQITQALDAAPPSVLLGIMVRDPRLRERSRDRLADHIAGHLDRPDTPDHRQLGLRVSR